MPLETPTRKAWLRRHHTHLNRYVLTVFVIVVLIAVPGYLSTRPDTFAHYDSLETEYRSWSTSTHAEVGCDDCHVAPGPLSNALFRIRMVGEYYASFIAPSRKPTALARPTNEGCLVCHSDLRTVSPKGDLQIPHRAHITILEMDCVECHGYLVHEKSLEGKHTPPMVECMSCHDGDSADDACTACHTSKAAPENHSAADWLVVHGAHSEDPACADCHQWRDDWCVDCHADRPRSHSGDWRAVHGDAVSVHRSCEACHEGSFCIECHGDVPQLGFTPALELVD